MLQFLLLFLQRFLKDHLLVEQTFAVAGGLPRSSEDILDGRLLGQALLWVLDIDRHHLLIHLLSFENLEVKHLLLPMD